MDDWREVWERKGNSDTGNLRWLNGYEATQADGRKIAQAIMEALKITPNHKVLEVGCGAGYLAQFVAGRCRYFGIDRSGSLIRKHLEILGGSVCVAEANDLPFEDGCFDRVFCHGVFHYFPDHKYAQRVVSEMRLVSSGSIFISDLPLISSRSSHLLFRPGMFGCSTVSQGLYEPHVYSRFNVLLGKR